MGEIMKDKLPETNTDDYLKGLEEALGIEIKEDKDETVSKK
jgi:hypothetical protein